MIEDKATEKLKKRLKDMGLIVNMGAEDTEPVSTEKHAVNQKDASNQASKSKKGSRK